jgi:hypothetical protein
MHPIAGACYHAVAVGQPGTRTSADHSADKALNPNRALQVGSQESNVGPIGRFA